jgi:hypothetical protein
VSTSKSSEMPYAGDGVGATAVQIVYTSRRGSRDIEHIGSAHDDVEMGLLKAAARQRLAARGPPAGPGGLQPAEPMRAQSASITRLSGV